MRKKDVNGMRPCRVCGTWFPANSKYFYQRHWGGLSSECRDCSRKQNTINQKARYYAGDKDFHIGYITRNAKQRAKKAGLAFDLDVPFMQELLNKQQGCCAISGVELTFCKGAGHVSTNASIDRIEPGKGYTRHNVQLVAWQVNIMKHNLGTTQLIEWCRLIINVPAYHTLLSDQRQQT